MTHISTSPPRVKHPKPIATPCHPSAVRPGVPQIELAARRHTVAVHGLRCTSLLWAATSAACSATKWKLLHRRPSVLSALEDKASRPVARVRACVRACVRCCATSTTVTQTQPQPQPQDAARAVCCVRGNHCMSHGEEDEHERMDGGLQNTEPLQSCTPSLRASCQRLPCCTHAIPPVPPTTSPAPLYIGTQPHPQNNALLPSARFRIPEPSQPCVPTQLRPASFTATQPNPNQPSRAQSSPAQPNPAHSLSPPPPTHPPNVSLRPAMERVPPHEQGPPPAPRETGGKGKKKKEKDKVNAACPRAHTANVALHVHARSLAPRSSRTGKPSHPSHLPTGDGVGSAVAGALRHTIAGRQCGMRCGGHSG
ncbi:hypothetical protein PMIN01_01644 [Paraphaeosphaeria minitans]|uniref:Uncharacterized protein n=1 Tax=Paraphaeosphaeria minitans TaxID=565426 RepID=A0A9P6GR65_9PLEO|nr:hypothetical protein PMIN01_01644 [Paraphaeosphaeria minitans]